MNKLTKIGVSALCGSLAGISAANAGEITVSGSATATYTQLGYGVTGNPLGMHTGLTFKGSGELDNGSTFTLTLGHTDKNTYSASAIAITTPSMGTFTYDEGGGTGADRYDDMMPTAWEETDGAGVTAGLVTVSGAGGGTDIEWAAPADMLGDGTTLHISYSPKADGTKASDKAVGGAAAGNIDGSGYDVAISTTSLADGLKLFGAYGEISQGGQDDHSYGIIGATYAVGSVTLGYQYSKDNHNDPDATGYYENNAFGISFAVNDDLSISFGQHESERKSDLSTVGATLEAQSLQMAYSMGGATIKIAETSVDNGDYDSTTASDRDGTTIALSLAF